jgi:bifunctional UDP-N-acetylglucosamine pyrophosphorylase/glucosamine-1-phosphate N-acetyltransferase
LVGKTLLEHVVHTAATLAEATIHVVYGHGGERVPNALKHLDVTWVEQAQHRGTGHAVAQALPRVPEDDVVLVLYGDVPLIRAETLRQLVERAADGELAILTAVLHDATGYGRVVRDAAGRVLKVVEHRDASEDEIKLREINTGLMACPATMLRGWMPELNDQNAQREYYLTDIIGLAVDDGVPVSAIVAPNVDEILGINDRLQLAAAEAALRKRRAEVLMATGVTLRDPTRIDVRGEIVCGRDVMIDVNTIFEGEVHLGDRVRIGPNCVIRDTDIVDDTEVLSHTVTDDAVIGANARIGPFARLRPETRLADDVHIGNFVEVKKSELGEGSKANHHSYVGDATIGARVNIGAGVITVNYDGVNKHRTVVEDDAFVGSDVQLIAPVKVGAGAFIAAGSSINGDAPPGELTIGRARQTTIPGWRRPEKKK